MATQEEIEILLQCLQTFNNHTEQRQRLQQHSDLRLESTNSSAPQLARQTVPDPGGRDSAGLAHERGNGIGGGTRSSSRPDALSWKRGGNKWRSVRLGTDDINTTLGAPQTTVCLTNGRGTTRIEAGERDKAVKIAQLAAPD